MYSNHGGDCLLSILMDEVCDNLYFVIVQCLFDDKIINIIHDSLIVNTGGCIKHHFEQKVYTVKWVLGGE